MIEALFDNNVRWAAARARTEPKRLRPPGEPPRFGYFWIGCSDEATPPHETVGLGEDEIFVHRNVANQAPAQDAGFLAGLQFAVEVLKVRHVIVCGHYGCEAIRMALSGQRHGFVDHWLQPVCALHRRNAAELAAVADPEARANALCERNVLAQVAGLADNPIVRDAWRRGQTLAIHGWIYSPQDGLLRDMETSAASARQAVPLAQAAGSLLAPTRKTRGTR